MIYKISEIFESVQGEGGNAGRLATFVRFAGCNGSCDFCDTIHEERIQMNVEELSWSIEKKKNAFVILTGGEPCLQLDLPLLEALDGYFVAVETNGSIELSRRMLDRIDWVACSPKAHLPGGPPFKLKGGEELKVVWDGKVDPIGLAGEGRWLKKFIQPEWNKWKEHLPAMMKFLKVHQNWLLSVQTHKFLGIL